MQNPSLLHKLEGKSNAHLVSLDDGDDYVIKYLQPGFEKSLANEWIAYCLARYLGAPVPFARIAEIPEEITTQVQNSVPIIPSEFQFASRYIPGTKNLHQSANIKTIANSSSLAAIILLDYWLMNQDRTRKNILLKKLTNGTYHIWAIDHAELFQSYSWTLEELQIDSNKLLISATHEFLCQYIDSEKWFYHYLDIIQKMPAFLIEEIVEVIPDDWLLSREEKKKIASLLIRRRKKSLPKTMQRFIKLIYRPIHSG